MFLRYSRLVFMLVNLIILSVSAQEVAQANKMRGGGTLSLASVEKRFNAFLAAGKHDEAVAFAKRFAVQKRVSDSYRQDVFLLLTMEALENGHNAEYEEYIELAKEVDVSFGHYLNMIHFFEKSDSSTSLDSFIWLATNHHSKLNNINSQFIFQIFRTLKSDPEKQFRFLKSLFSFGYQSERLPEYSSFFYVELARLYLEKNEVSQAENVADTFINQFSDNILIWHDRQFEKLWRFQFQKGNFDPAKAIAKYIIRVEQALENTSELTWDEWIRGSRVLVEKYLSLGKTEQAINIATNALEQIPEEYKENDSALWLTQALISAYEQAGEWDSARRTSQNLLQINVESNSIMINFIINYSGLLWRSNYSNEALVVADKILTKYKKFANSYGLYIARAVKACVLTELNRNKEAKQIFDEMKQVAENNYVATIEAGLCTKDYDSVAQIIIQRLNEPDERKYVLASFSTYLVNGLSQKEFKFYQAYQKLLDREDIKKQVRRYGRVKKWSLPASYWLKMF
ncbi:tetratricopeptide repeat protein [Aliikangiella coralliicola]|uniref:Tetratricopeptide repeat protein n=1 Tax=Aliikangiella coralliicola TaxID=2592383 RepID=A0A545U7P1_9GAMM|nr:hypothetical protein [Aliikangiella coralliicola]TQV85490.1 hypothetical protein FLL46_20210 [Aliikangiella coralliicola]